jgi:hypothetical protein
MPRKYLGGSFETVTQEKISNFIWGYENSIRLEQLLNTQSDEQSVDPNAAASIKINNCNRHKTLIIFIAPLLYSFYHFLSFDTFL